MKTPLVLLLLLLLPAIVFAATFERDLFFGLKSDPDVTRLQEFLRDQGLYAGPATGNFFSLTREGVKKFQEREKIDPPAGYFGPKTRARANELLGAATIAAPVTRETILAKIEELRAKLKALEEQLAKEQAAKPVEAVVPATPAEEVKPAPAPLPKVVNITGTSTGAFPAVEQTDTKIGEISVKNDTDISVLFANFETLIHDSMDSTPNRSRKVTFVLRDGLLSSNTSISKTEFTFLSTTPKVGEEHRSPVTLPFAVTLAAGKEKKVSLWVEQLLYVKSGTLRVEATKVNTATPVEITGLFDFILTREPPL